MRPFAGVPYDGNDPDYAAFYIEKHNDTSSTYPVQPGVTWPPHWKARIVDLIDQYEPDLLYTDGGLPFGKVGMEVVAHHYNSSVRRSGALDVVYTFRDPERHGGYNGDPADGFATLDIERGVIEGISGKPWQTCTCLGGWFYDSRQPDAGLGTVWRRPHNLCGEHTRRARGESLHRG